MSWYVHVMSRPRLCRLCRLLPPNAWSCNLNLDSRTTVTAALRKHSAGLKRGWTTFISVAQSVVLWTFVSTGKVQLASASSDSLAFPQTCSAASGCRGEVVSELSMSLQTCNRTQPGSECYSPHPPTPGSSAGISKDSGPHTCTMPPQASEYTLV